MPKSLICCGSVAFVIDWKFVRYFQPITEIYSSRNEKSHNCLFSITASNIGSAAALTSTCHQATEALWAPSHPRRKHRPSITTQERLKVGTLLPKDVDLKILLDGILLSS